MDNVGNQAAKGPGNYTALLTIGQAAFPVLIWRLLRAHGRSAAHHRNNHLNSPRRLVQTEITDKPACMWKAASVELRADLPNSQLSRTIPRRPIQYSKCQTSRSKREFDYVSSKENTYIYSLLRRLICVDEDATLKGFIKDHIL